MGLPIESGWVPLARPGPENKSCHLSATDTAQSTSLSLSQLPLLRAVLVVIKLGRGWVQVRVLTGVFKRLRFSTIPGQQLNKTGYSFL